MIPRRGGHACRKCHRRSHYRPAGRRLRLEPLEPRQLLAGGWGDGPDTPVPKNVILMIGDGMGVEHVNAARMFLGGDIVFDHFPQQAEMTTFSANSSVTDSAASGTAIATGEKVDNGVISMAIPGDGTELTTSLEILQDLGKATGLVTTTTITHATPAAFAAHATNRALTNDIADDLLNQSRPNVLFGGGGAGMTAAAATAAGYTVVDDRADLLALDTDAETFVSGQFGSDHLPYEYDGLGDLPHLSEMAATALDVLDNDTDGFFLMVEGGRIDHAGHANDIQRNVRETVEFANTVQLVLDWAAARTDTLIIVTADHETGGMTVVADNGQGNAPEVTWSTGGHTGANVPVYAWGANGQLAGVLDNTDIFALSLGNVQPLGAVAFLELDNQNPSAGALWFRLEPLREGLLTVEAISAAPQSTAVVLFDQDFGQLATSTLVDGNQRIDWPTAAGTTYFLKLSGTATDVDLRLANLVQLSPDGRQVTVFGTAEDDMLQVVAGVPHTLTINGVQYKSDLVGRLQFFGGDGVDSVSLSGSEADEVASLYPNSGTMTGPGYEVELSGVSSIAVDGGGGADTVRLYDSPGDDRFLGAPHYGKLSGEGFSNEAAWFRYVYADARSGGNDVAKLYDSRGNDHFLGKPDYAKFSGEGFSVQTEYFEAVHAYASGGGADVAKLYDSPADDHFYATPVEAALSGNGYFNRVKFFEGVHAYATAGGSDSATLFDSPGDDTGYATPVEAALFGDGFFNRAKFFERVLAQAVGGGHDQIELLDSPGDDRFVATPSYAGLKGDGYASETKFFDVVRAYANAGGVDVAKLFDSPGDDRFVATPDFARLKGDAFSNQAEFFDRVHAYGSAGGADVAKLFDSTGDDTFYATAREGALFGEAFYNRAKHFDAVHAYATAGGLDTAWLFDSPGNDMFYATENYAALMGEGYYNRAKHFEEVYAEAAAGGHDEAYLNDSALVDLLEAGDDWARLSNETLELLYEISAFEYGKAIASTPGDTKVLLPVSFDLELEGPWEDR